MTKSKTPGSSRHMNGKGQDDKHSKGDRGRKVDVLPNAWNQSVSDVVRIFDVTGQVPHKYFFFV